MNPQAHHGAAERSRSDHETRDVRNTVVLRFALGLVLVVVSCLVANSWVFDLLTGEPSERAPESPASMDDKEQVLRRRESTTMPGQELAELRRIEDDRLERFARIDRETDIFRIPVGRAIDLLAERGLPGSGGPREEGSSR